MDLVHPYSAYHCWRVYRPYERAGLVAHHTVFPGHEAGGGAPAASPYSIFRKSFTEPRANAITHALAVLSECRPRDLPPSASFKRRSPTAPRPGFRDKGEPYFIEAKSTFHAHTLHGLISPFQGRCARMRAIIATNTEPTSSNVFHHFKTSRARMTLNIAIGSLSVESMPQGMAENPVPESKQPSRQQFGVPTSRNLVAGTCARKNTKQTDAAKRTSKLQLLEQTQNEQKYLVTLTCRSRASTVQIT